MKLRKRFVAWILAGVMVVSSVQFPASSVFAEEMESEIESVVAETEELESKEDSEWESVCSSESDVIIENEPKETEELVTVTVETDNMQFESESENRNC